MHEHPEQPKRFKRFEVTGLLGQGGMGVVYLARDPVIGREVAIKVLRPDPGLSVEEREGLRARFEQEFRSAGTLSHPSLVTVYDVGQEGESSFIAMEYVSGQSLSGLIASGQELSFKEIADLATQVGGGLDYAHERGIIHRDVKPANILITEQGLPKITDFGVAKVVSSSLTRTGTVVGTPAYMSPEQITGQSVSGASDQFSLAVILYQMLTGELPFSGDNPTTILYKIVHESPCGAAQLNPSLPPELDQVLLRALHKNPAERYPSCTALARAVSEALGAFPKVSEESVQKTVTLSQVNLAGGSGTYGGASSWWQRQKPAPRIGMVAAGIALTLGLGWWSFVHLSGESLGNLDFFGRDDGGGQQVSEDSSAPQDSPLASDPSPFSGTLQVSSNQTGAEIWVNGSNTGLVVPAAVPLEGVTGEVMGIELRRGQQVVARSQRKLGPAMVPLWEAAEEPLVERYRITSDPPGASVLLQGKSTGLVTPAEIDLTVGESYQLVVALEGYDRKGYAFAFPGDLRPEERSSRSLPFRLEPSVPPGYLVIDAPYPVSVDWGKGRAAAKSNHEISLPPGTYEVKLSAPDVFLQQTWPGLSVESGGRRPLRAPQSVRVRIAAVPANCRVSIDGRYVDEAPFDQPLVVGNHEFRFEWPSEGQVKTISERITSRTTRVVGSLR